MSNMHRILTKVCSLVRFTTEVSVLCIGIGRANTVHPGVKNLEVTDFAEQYTVYAYYDTPLQLL